MTVYRVLVYFLFCSNVMCQDCVTFDFERDFNRSFNNEVGVCRSLFHKWNIGHYDNIPVNSIDEQSTKFIYPNVLLSCTSSFTFQMTASGVLEVNLFMLPTSSTDQVTIHANQIVANGPDVLVGNAWIIATDENFVSGWNAVKINIRSFGTFFGYITLLGMAAESSIVLVDSFRYMSPNINEEECIIYKKPDTTTTDGTNDKTSTEKDTTPSSSSCTTITTNDYTSTTSIQTDEPNTMSTTADTDLTTRQIQTDPDPTTQTGDPKTTDIYSSTYSTLITESDTETIYFPSSTTPSTIETTSTGNSDTTPDADITNPSTNPSTESRVTEINTTTSLQIDLTTTTFESVTTVSSTQTFSEDNTESTLGMTSSLTTKNDSTSISTTDSSTTYIDTTTDGTQLTTDPSTTIRPSDPISTAEDINPTTTNSPITNTTTENPPVIPKRSFWNAYTITMVILLNLIVVIVSSIVWYCIGKRRHLSESQIILPYIIEPSKTLTIPRAIGLRNGSMTTNRISSLVT